MKLLAKAGIAIVLLALLAGCGDDAATSIGSDTAASTEIPRLSATSGLVLDSSGSSMVVFVMRSVVAAVTDSDAPLGASLVRKAVSLMVTASGPDVATAPPSPELTLKS